MKASGEKDAALFVASATKLKEHIGWIQRTLSDLETLDLNSLFSTADDHHDVAAAELSDTLAYQLDRLALELSVHLEALGLLRTRARLLREWPRFQQHGLEKTAEMHTSEVDYRESKPFFYLRALVDAIAGLAKIPASDDLSRAPRGLDHLEFVLRSTAKIVRDSGGAPRNEHDVQRVMHKHLENTFKSFTKSPKISRPIKSFKPDAGVIDLHAAVEFKFADSDKEVKRALSGIMEDVIGYSGSRDWTRFYSVIYMTGAYAVEGQVARALGTDLSAWKTILVTGEGRR